MITGRFVLPDDVTLVPVASLPESLRTFAWNDGDVAISRAKSRSASRIVGADAAALVREFATPATIVEAVLRFSRARNEDAEQTLEQAYPILDALIANGVLIAEDAPRTRLASLAIGDAWRDWTVAAIVQVLEGTELYQLQRGAELAALKLADCPRERRVLARAGDVAPRVLDEDDDFLLLEWIRGVDAKTAATDEGLCARIANAFATLHERGVIHGDVHPRNVLVQRDGSVRLIDFGNASLDGDAPPRAGVPFFYEPELAAAMRAAKPSPPPTEAGEQYAVAALLHLLETGRYTHDFSLERDELLRQIAEEAPRVDDEVLRRALSKEPADRYPTMRELALALNRWSG
ncbi:MAG TPA: lipopolysaccharide core heptose(II) kinase RfaY, partial [Thermoanaerobaculia bacterium]|nr:lipopolysaccharide core heptose(II) kinase RfaY [Thermoanaerobaculia bacterium]